MTCKPLVPPREPYEEHDQLRVCFDNAFWQGWFWDGQSRCPKGHPSLVEIDGGADGYAWCAEDADQSYGPLWWYRLQPCDPPGGALT